MSDTTDKPAPKKLQLSRSIEKGKVQQTFSRGRSKTVTVEVKKTRSVSRGPDGQVTVEKRASTVTSTPEDVQSDGLTSSEREARMRALKEAENSSPRETIKPPTQRPQKPQPEEPKVDVAPPVPDQTVIEGSKETARKTHGHGAIPEKKDKEREDIRLKAPKPVKERDEKRTKARLTIANIYEQDEERERSLASIKRARQKAKRKNIEDAESGSREKAQREIVIPETITVQELANRMAVRANEVVRELMKLGIMANVNQVIDADTAELVATELGHQFRRVTDADVENILQHEADTEEVTQPRPPVVTVMGHVDHGKTSLLDALRQSDVVSGEAGGITQHIGAYQVTVPSGEKVTFVDTPGHAAFTAMRARGAKVTDIVVLVVAADDGIMPQTVEAINHAKAAEVPIIVAINKIDKQGADPSRVKNELLAHELIAEDLGGDTMVVEVSALQKLNLDKLLETILLQAEILELKANADADASGTVVEAELDKGRGVVATLLVQRGTLHTGDIVVAGTGFGKIRTILNDKGDPLEEATPSMPVSVLGLSELPTAGDHFAVVSQEKQAREIIDYRLKKERDLKAAENLRSVENLFANAKTGKKELCVLIKGDVQGSVEAIRSSLEEITHDDVAIKALHTAAGGVAESDISLAEATGAIVLAFNVRASSGAQAAAEKAKVDIRYYSVIYDLIDDMKAAVTGMLNPVIREEFIGKAEIKEVFKITKVGKVAGCIVSEGVVRRGAGVRLIRDDVVIHEGKLKTLKRFKDEVPEVKQGTECGMAFEKYEDMRVGDVIEAFQTIEEKQTLA